jgi:hypothetical protein
MPAAQTIRKAALTAGALGAIAFGGSAIADAASSSSGAPSGTSAPQSAPDPTTPGGHVGPNGTEKPLADAVAKKVEAAAKAKVPGATIERVETDADHGSPYEAHMRKSDGTELEVLVNSDFQVTAVNPMGQR